MFGPWALAFLVVWYIVHRFGGDVRSTANRVAARGADAVAGAADRVSGGQDTGGLRASARRVGDRFRAAAGRLRSRPSPATPRTAAGQSETARRAAKAAGSRLGMVLLWLRLSWVDAVAAAENAQWRRGTVTNDPPRRWWTWPTGDEPQAPIWADSERADRDPLPALGEA